MKQHKPVMVPGTKPSEDSLHSGNENGAAQNIVQLHDSGDSTCCFLLGQSVLADGPAKVRRLHKQQLEKRDRRCAFRHLSAKREAGTEPNSNGDICASAATTS